MVEAFDIHSNENLGSMEVALAISLILFGILVIQAYNYFQDFNDGWLLKSLATVVLILEVFHSYIITHTIYFITVTLAGRQNIGPNSYFLTTGVVLETLIAALVQSYFSYRIYRVPGGKLHIPILCWFLSLLRLGGGLALAIESYLKVPLVHNAILVTQSSGWLITLVVTVGASVDVFIAASLCYYIKHLAPSDPSRRHGVEASVDKLMTWIIQTGLVTSVASVAVVILFQTLKEKEIWFSVYTILAKLYSNAFFGALNARQDKENCPGSVSKLVFTNLNTPFELTVDKVRTHHSANSVSSPYSPSPSLPEKALDSSFRHTFDGDSEAHGQSRF